MLNFEHTSQRELRTCSSTAGKFVKTRIDSGMWRERAARAAKLMTWVGTDESKQLCRCSAACRSISDCAEAIVRKQREQMESMEPSLFHLRAKVIEVGTNVLAADSGSAHPIARMV
jgi:hypothetical protein